MDVIRGDVSHYAQCFQGKYSVKLNVYVNDNAYIKSLSVIISMNVFLSVPLKQVLERYITLNRLRRWREDQCHDGCGQMHQLWVRPRGLMNGALKLVASSASSFEISWIGCVSCTYAWRHYRRYDNVRLPTAPMDSTHDEVSLQAEIRQDYMYAQFW
jgi:hypothetical protein